MRTILSAFVGVDNPDPDKLQDIVDFEIALAGVYSSRICVLLLVKKILLIVDNRYRFGKISAKMT